MEGGVTPFYRWAGWQWCPDVHEGPLPHRGRDRQTACDLKLSGPHEEGFGHVFPVDSYLGVILNEF